MHLELPGCLGLGNSPALLSLLVQTGTWIPAYTGCTDLRVCPPATSGQGSPLEGALWLFPETPGMSPADGLGRPWICKVSVRGNMVALLPLPASQGLSWGPLSKEAS